MHCHHLLNFILHTIENFFAKHVYISENIDIMAYHSLQDGAKMYYEHYLFDTEKPTIVFLNGLSQATAVWTGTKFFLGNERNYLLLDNIFQGQSDKEGNFRSFEAHAQDVAELCNSLGIKKIIPVGISYGSAIAQRLLTNYASVCEKAVLMSTFAYKTSLFETIGHSWKRALEVGGYELMLDVMLPNVFGMPYFENPVIPIEQIRAMRAGLNENKNALLTLMRATEESGNYLSELSKVKQPVLILQGELDILTTPQMAADMQKVMVNSGLQIIQGKGHSLNIEAVPEIVFHINQFLN